MEKYHLCIYKKPAKNRGVFAYYFTKIILFIFPNFILNKLEKLSKKIITYNSNIKTEYVNNFFGENYEKVKRKVMGESILYDFEGKSFPIPTLYDEYLKTLYGDYMKIPDKNKRQPKHKLKIFNEREDIK